MNLAVLDPPMQHSPIMKQRMSAGAKICEDSGAFFNAAVNFAARL